ncbi:MAG TPA: glycosyltransferase family 2 protein [Acidimicrobiales bacterium]|nr:glycosyltransferase family 2 protein [Acidimicrobiales bacterium]
MSTPADVDIGVVTWNTAALTVECLSRLYANAGGCRFRLYVRDNGSTDGTAERIAEEFPDAVIEADAHNLGFAAGMNRLLALSAPGAAPWFLALNPDAWPEPGAVGRLVETGNSLSTAAAVAPRLERPDGTLEHSTHPFPSLRMALLHALGGRWWLPERVLEREMLEGHWMHDRLRPVEWAVGAALLMRRGLVEELGGFDERFFMYAEDMEWCWRVHRAGYDVLFDPEARFRHVGNASGVQAYGGDRLWVETESAYAFHRMAHGPASTRAYRLVSAVAAAEMWAGARLRGDHAAAERWANQARAHLGRRPDPGQMKNVR